MDIKAIIAIVLAIAVAVGLTWVVNTYVFPKSDQFDITQVVTNIIIVLVVVGVGAFVANKITHKQGIEVKANLK